MRRFLVYCNILLAFSIMIPMHKWYSLIQNIPYLLKRDELSWFWDVFLYGDLYLILLETSNLALVVALSFLIVKSKKEFNKKICFVVLFISLSSLAAFYLSSKFRFTIPVDIFWEYEIPNHYIYDAVILSIFSMALILVLASNIHGLLKKRTLAFKIIHLDLCLILIGMYLIKPYFTVSMFNIISTIESYYYYYTVPMFLLSIIIFVLLSIVGLRYRIFNYLSLVFFVLSFVSVSYGFLITHEVRNFKYIYMTKVVMFYLLPLFFVMAIMLVMLLTKKRNRTEKLAQPELASEEV